MDRVEFRLDPATARRLERLQAKLELRRPDLIRMAVRVLAEREGVELPDGR